VYAVLFGNKKVLVQWRVYTRRSIAAISRATDRGDDRRDDRVYVYTVRSAAIASCKRRVMLALRHHALT